jgi:sorting and assembly machinery component 37
VIDELPALKNGDVWVSKFRNIVDYVRQYSDQAWDLDADWTGLDKADIAA